MMKKFYLIESASTAFSPLATSSKALLKRLGFEILSDLNNRFDSYWARIADFERLVEFEARRFSRASTLEAELLALEEDSYLNSLLAFERLSQDKTLAAKIASKLASEGIEFALQKPLYLPELLGEGEDSHLIAAKRQSDFIDFKAAWIGSSRAGDLPSQGWLRALEPLLGLKVLEGAFSREGYGSLFSFNPDMALLQSARIYFEAIDQGVDFILTTSVSQFEMMDRESRALLKASGRDRLGVPLLYPSQLFLLALGERDRKALGFDLHRIGVPFI